MTFIYMAQNTFNGHDLFSKHQTMEIIMPASRQPINRAVPVPALRCRAYTVLFSIVFGPTHRVSAR